MASESTFMLYPLGGHRVRL